MRVLFIAESLDLPESHMIRGISKAGIEVELMINEDSQHLDTLAGDNIPIHAFALKRRIDRDGIRAIRYLLESRSFDIVHCLKNRPLSNALIASRGMHVKKVAYRGIEGNVNRFNPASWLTYLNPGIDRIVCVCEAIRRKFIEMRVPESRLSTIYKGHDISWYQSFKRADLGEFGIPQEALVAGGAANMRPRKGTQVLIRAAEHVTAGKPVHYLLAGKLNDGNINLKEVSDATADRIHFIGFRDDASRIMGACDVFVLPSLRREGLPKGVIEAMAQRVPAVVTDSGGSPELVRHEKDGMVVPPDDVNAMADAITYTLADEQRRRRMGESAQRRIQKDFHIDETISQHLDMYKDLVAK